MWWEERGGSIVIDKISLVTDHKQWGEGNATGDVYSIMDFDELLVRALKANTQDYKTILVTRVHFPSSND